MKRSIQYFKNDRVSKRTDEEPQRAAELADLASTLADLRLVTQIVVPFPILKLPVELVLNVTDHLEPPAINALRMTCRRLYTVVSGIKRTQMCPECQLQFSKLIRRDRYAEICQLERDGGLDKRLLVCGACRKPHDRVFFSQGQKMLDPYLRHCFGMQGYLEFCPHRMFRLDKLRRLAYHQDGLLRDLPSLGLKLCRECPEKAQRHRGFGRLHLTGFSVPSHHRPGGRWARVEISRDYYITLASRSEPSFEGQVARALSKLNVRVCPHTKLSDLVPGLNTSAGSSKHPTEGAEYQVATERIPGDDLRRIAAPLEILPVSNETEWTSFYRSGCGVLNCKTRVELRRVPSWDCQTPSKDHIIATIRNDLGDLRDANDPRWLRQIVLLDET
ncbi:hypothetical protein EV356DRAFT_501311 [Viridothelium virens]|uniref:F-box domain-containing protein n=1 Tax=Viridothelium virens TaxID=1048519 RepID=A0A6A6HA60_VIRVR|nr:hypothetical protein EV356DRAFT_501311 [Viridothelium virens]